MCKYVCSVSVCVDVDVDVGVCDYAEDAGNPNGSIREVRVIRTQGQVLADVLMKVLVLIKTRSLQGCYGGRVDGVFWWWWVLGIGCMSLGVRGIRYGIAPYVCMDRYG